MMMSPTTIAMIKPKFEPPDSAVTAVAALLAGLSGLSALSALSVAPGVGAALLAPSVCVPVSAVTGSTFS